MIKHALTVFKVKMELKQRLFFRIVMYVEVKWIIEKVLNVTWFYQLLIEWQI